MAAGCLGGGAEREKELQAGLEGEGATDRYGGGRRGREGQMRLEEEVMRKSYR